MCTIAAYNGDKAAFPILVEMMEAMQGFNSGFFTGIATIDEGKLYYQKVVGDLSRLLKIVNAENMPGKIGIIHSRTNADGTVNRAHPFVGFKDGQPYLAHVSNCTSSFFKDKFDAIGAVADKIQKEGYVLSSRERLGPQNPSDKDGYTINISDLVTQYTMKMISEGNSSDISLELGLLRIPTDIAALNISLNDSSYVSYGRIGKPLSIAFSSHGVYMSSSEIVFPSDSETAVSLPPLSVGRVYKDHYITKPIDMPPCQVLPITDSLSSDACEIISGILKREKLSFREIKERISKDFSKEKILVPIDSIIYESLARIHKEGRLKAELKKTEGKNGFPAPITYFFI